MSGGQPGWGIAEAAAITVNDCRAVAFAPDGSALAVLGGDLLTFLEYPDRDIWSAFCDPASNGPAAVTWSCSGDRVYVLGAGQLSAYEPESGALVTLPRLVGELGALSAIAASADEHLVAIGTASGQVLVLAERTETTMILGGATPVTALAWRPGSVELCVARGATVEFWDVPAHVMLTSVHIPDSPVSQLALASDGRTLAAVSPSAVHKIRVGAPSDRAVTARWPDHAALPPGAPPLPVSARFSRDGSRLLIGIAGGPLVVTDRDLQLTGQIAADITSPWTLDISRDGLLAIRATTDSVRLWELPDTIHNRHRFTAAGQRWAARQGKTVGRALPASPGHGPALATPRVMPLAGEERATAFAWWPDGRTACVATSPGTLARVQLPMPQPLWEWPCADGPVTHVAACQQGLVAVTHGDLVSVLDAAGREVAALAGGGAPAWSSAKGPEWLLAVAEPGPRPRQVLLYHPHDLAREPQRLPMPDGVGSLSWSPDGGLLAAAGRGQLVLWDARTRRREIAPLRAGGRDRMSGPVAWSPDGQRLAAVSRTERSAAVTIWNTRTWRTAGEMRVPARKGWPPLAWSPDGRLFAFVATAANEDNDEIEIWDPVTRQRLTTLTRPGSGRIAELAWSPDGDAIAATHADGTVVLWDIADAAPRSAPGPAELPFDRKVLVQLACTASMVGAAVPLSLLAGLLALLDGDPPDELRAFATHRGVNTLRGSAGHKARESGS